MDISPRAPFITISDIHIGLYCTRLLNEDGVFVELVRFHFGFPEEIVKPLCVLLESDTYFGEKHWKEINGDYIWATTISGKIFDAPYRVLLDDAKWRVRNIINVQYIISHK